MTEGLKQIKGWIRTDSASGRGWTEEGGGTVL